MLSHHRVCYVYVHNVSLYRFTCFRHLAIFLKIYPIEQPFSTRPDWAALHSLNPQSPCSTECLRMSTKSIVLHNLGGEQSVYLREWCRNRLPVQLNCTFIKHNHQPSFLPAESLHCSMTWVYNAPQNCADMPNWSSTTLLCIVPKNCAEMPNWPVLPCFVVHPEIAQTCLAVPLLPVLHYSQKLRSHVQ